MKDPKYFNVREYSCWLTGEKRTARDARKADHAIIHRRRNMAHRAKLYAHA
jgi:hypothetical protein